VHFIEVFAIFHRINDGPSQTGLARPKFKIRS